MNINTPKPDLMIYQAVVTGHWASELTSVHAMGLQTITFHEDEETSADFFIAKFSNLLKRPILD